MATNFWASSQAAQLLSKEALGEAHTKDRARGLSAAQLERLTNYHIKYIRDLAKCGYSHGVRQRVAATACVFFRRFYLRGNDFCVIDPRGVAPAALYLAAKVEETLLQARYLFQLMQKLAGKYPVMLPFMEVKVLMDLEMALLEELEYRLVVWHPYTDLAAFLADAKLTDISKSAWSVVDDSYCTDLCLQYPPHIIAVGCLSVAAVLMQKDHRRWMEGLDIDLDQVYNVTLDLMKMYEPARMEGSKEEIRQLLNRLR